MKVCKLLQSKVNSHKECDCKSCYKKTWYENNKTRILEKRKVYAAENREKIAEYKKNHAKANSGHIAAYREVWVKANKTMLNEKARVRTRNRHRTDPFFRLTRNLRRRIHHVFKDDCKSKTTLDLLGCSFQDVFDHISKQFQVGMTWENYGKWHVDHKYPLSLAKSTEELEKLCHYSNLQPLWAIDNVRKSNKLIHPNLNVSINSPEAVT